MQWMMLAVVIGMTLLGSIYFAAPSSTITIVFIAVVGIIGIGGHLKTIALQQAEPMQTILAGLYYCIPHLEWYDLRDFVVYDQHPAPWSAVALASVYAGLWTACFLMLALVGFRKKNLTA
jgi:hypothetical protein